MTAVHRRVGPGASSGPETQPPGPRDLRAGGLDSARLGGGHRLLHPDPVDGAHGVQAGVRRGDLAAQVHLQPHAGEFRLVFSGFGPFIEHSAIATIGSTVLVLVLALPAAYALSIHPVKGWRDSLFFFISTKMLPVVAAIGPLYVIALKAHLLDSIWLLIILYAAMNLPLAIWMIRSFMLEVPSEMLEAARLDGAGRIREITEVIMPVVSPGLVSTALICIIFAWNELFLALNLTVTNAATMPMFLISSVPQEGLYIAHLSAAATVASVPVIIVGWIAQRSLVRGLSMGAIK